MISASRTVAALWLIWILAWIIAARWTAPTVARQATSSRLAHSALLAVGAALLFFHPSRFGMLPRSLLPETGWLPWIGVVVTVLGLGMAGWARAHLGRLWSGSVTIKSEHTIVRTGPYAFTRHPIYTGLLLAFVGTALVNGTVAGVIGLVLLALGIVLKIRQEEQLLVEHFGEAYRIYAAEVPALIPRLRRGTSDTPK